MAVERVQAFTGTATAGAGAVSATATVGAGNLLIAVVACDLIGATPSISDGGDDWTELEIPGAAQHNRRCWWASNVAGGSTTVTVSGIDAPGPISGSAALLVLELSGADPDSPLEVWSAAAAVNGPYQGTLYPADTEVTAWPPQAGDYLVGMLGFRTSYTCSTQAGVFQPPTLSQTESSTSIVSSFFGYVGCAASDGPGDCGAGQYGGFKGKITIAGGGTANWHVWFLAVREAVVPVPFSPIIVQHKSVQSTGFDPTSLTVTLDAATTAGNTLILACSLSSTGDEIWITSIDGESWELADRSIFQTGDTGEIWYVRDAAGGDTTFTLYVNLGCVQAVEIFEVSGLLAAAPLDQVSHGDPNMYSDIDSGPTDDLLQPGEFVVSMVDVDWPNGVDVLPGPPWYSAPGYSAGSSGHFTYDLTSFYVSQDTSPARLQAGRNDTRPWNAVVATFRPAVTFLRGTGAGQTGGSATITQQGGGIAPQTVQTGAAGAVAAAWPAAPKGTTVVGVAAVVAAARTPTVLVGGAVTVMVTAAGVVVRGRDARALSVPAGVVLPPPALRPAVWRLLVRDASLAAVAEADVYTSLTVTLRWDDVSTWTVELPAGTDAAAVLAQPGSGLVVMRDGAVLLSGMTTRPQRRLGPREDGLTVSGVDDTAWLQRRLALPVPGGPPYDTAAYDVRTGPCETVLKAYVDANAGPGATPARRVPGLTLEPDRARGANVTGSARFDVLLDLLAPLAVAGGDLGFRVVQSAPGEGLEFCVYESADRTGAVLLGVEFGTLAELDYAVAAPTADWVYAGGGGEGTDRIIVEGGDPDAITAWGRVEVFRDRRDTDDLDVLAQAVAEELAGGVASVAFRATVVDTEGARFGLDYGLGDRVRALVDGVEVVQTVREVSITVDSRGEKVRPLVGTPSASDALRMLADLRDARTRIRSLERR